MLAVTLAMASAGACSFPDHQFLPVDQFNKLKEAGASSGAGGTLVDASGGAGGTVIVDASGGTGGTMPDASAGSSGMGGTSGAGSGGTSGAGGTSGSGGASGAGGTSGSGGASGAGGTSGSGGADAGPCGRVVINEVSTAGPAGATDEFVELYNAGTCSVSLNGWTLHYSSSSGSTTPTYWAGTSGESLAPSGFFVIAGAGFTGSKNGSLSGGLASGGGGVGLYDAGNVLVDSMAYATVLPGHPFVETTPCPNIPSGESASRIPDGYDTNDNSADFTITATRTPGASN